MAELDKGKPVSLEELVLTSLREGTYHGREVQAEAAGGARRVPAHP